MCQLLCPGKVMQWPKNLMKLQWLKKGINIWIEASIQKEYKVELDKYAKTKKSQVKLPEDYNDVRKPFLEADLGRIGPLRPLLAQRQEILVCGEEPMDIF